MVDTRTDREQIRYLRDRILTAVAQAEEFGLEINDGPDWCTYDPGGWRRSHTNNTIELPSLIIWSEQPDPAAHGHPVYGDVHHCPSCPLWFIPDPEVIAAHHRTCSFCGAPHYSLFDLSDFGHDGTVWTRFFESFLGRGGSWFMTGLCYGLESTRTPEPDAFKDMDAQGKKFYLAGWGLTRSLLKYGRVKKRTNPDRR